MERMSANGVFFHRKCFRCSHCNCQLKIGAYSLSKGEGGAKGKFFCSVHYRQLFLSNPEAINYSRAGVPKRSTSDLSPIETTPDPEEGLKKSDVHKALESVKNMETGDVYSSSEGSEIGSEISSSEEEDEEEDEHVSLSQNTQVSPVTQALSDEMEVESATPESDDQEQQQQQQMRKDILHSSDKEPLSPIQRDVIPEEEEEEEEEEEFEVISNHDEDVRQLLGEAAAHETPIPPLDTQKPRAKSLSEVETASVGGKKEVLAMNGPAESTPNTPLDPKDAKSFKRLTKPARTRSKTTLIGAGKAVSSPSLTTPPSPSSDPPVRRRPVRPAPVAGGGRGGGGGGGGVVARFSQQYEALDRAARHSQLESEEPVFARWVVCACMYVCVCILPVHVINIQSNKKSNT